MREERSVSQAMVARATWLLPAAGATLQWDGGSETYRDVGLSRSRRRCRRRPFG